MILTKLTIFGFFAMFCTDRRKQVSNYIKSADLVPNIERILQYFIGLTLSMFSIID